MKFSTDKDVNHFIRQLTRAGWRFRRGGKHGKLMPPGSPMCLTVPCSPSDHRALQNLRRDVRRLLAIYSEHRELGVTKAQALLCAVAIEVH